MFNEEFFPTPPDIIAQMIFGLDLKNKTVLEPEAGKGDIVDVLNEEGANVICCELNKDLQKILQTKCKVLADDFLTVTSDQISHIDCIVMNPPFSTAVEHILHAYEIAPKGCKIIALCNSSNIENLYTNDRKQLKDIIDSNGKSIDLGECFKDAERQTDVNVSMLTITKPGESYKSEFDGFFTDEEPEEAGQIGLMSYNVVRDLVNRYVAAVKLYDEQLTTGAKMNSLLSGFYGESLTFTCTENGAIKLRNEFKKDLQKSGWKFIFNKMDMGKHVTKGLREDINKFVEQQTEIPFTMKNIYHMLDMVMQTHGQRMDKALLEVFDRVTEHHHDNRHFIKGWKTNSHFLVGKKFILPNQINPANQYGYKSGSYNNLRASYDGIISDFEKALCYVSGKDYDKIKPLNQGINSNTYGEWYNSEFFKYKGYKNGNMHFEFNNSELWGKFNQRIAKLKGYPLFEGKEQTKYQDRQTGRAQQKKANPAHAYKPTILFEIKVA